MEWFSEIWIWLGNEIAAFGVRWIFVFILMSIFGGFIGRRYWVLKEENKQMKERISRLEQKLNTSSYDDKPAITDTGEIKPKDTMTKHGVITLGESGFPEKLTSWEEMKEGKLAPPPAGAPQSIKNND